MDAYASSPKSSRESSPKGAVILKIGKNGKLNIYPVGNSDKEVADVLAAVRLAIVQGDLAELLG
jgi:hypothetical protein